MGLSARHKLYCLLVGSTTRGRLWHRWYLHDKRRLIRQEQYFNLGWLCVDVLGGGW